MSGFRLLRSPPLLRLLPQLGIGIAASSSHAGTVNLGSSSGGGAPCSPSAERRRQQCVQLSTVPGADPQRCKELLLLAAATAGEGPGLRDLSGDPAKVNRRPTITFSISPGMCRITMKL